MLPFAALDGASRTTPTLWVFGFHVRPNDVFHALDAASSGVVEEGNVGYSWSLPVVAETWDGYLNDVNVIACVCNTILLARTLS